VKVTESGEPPAGLRSEAKLGGGVLPSKGADMIAHIPESASARFVRRRDQHYRRRLRTVRPGLLGGRYAHMEPDALSKICPRRILGLQVVIPCGHS
jgi:hypothetical protein